MAKHLVSWVGNTDLRAPEEAEVVGLGPIAQALEAREYASVRILSNYGEERVEPFLDWIRSRTCAPIECRYVELTTPTDFGEIYAAAKSLCDDVRASISSSDSLSLHLSPGTPAMAAVWIILGKTRYAAELIESSRERGVITAAVPFDISADFIPDLLRTQDGRLRELSEGRPPEAPEFADILHRSRVMSRVITRARRVAVRNVPVLVEGESGTGKELVSRAIHMASPRSEKPFVAVNCGAIPAELVESQLFGHVKGAFTGASSSHDGYFRAANSGTLFLDEVGELPGPAQVKLLRVVRIIAATNRTLTDEIADGQFREDLFYRLAVAVLKLPPLRERSGDIGMLVDKLLQQVNSESETEPGYEEKKLSAAARNILLQHPWPGNVRELLNTLRRASIWSDGPVIRADDAREVACAHA